MKSVRELPAPPWAAPVNCGQPVAGSYDGRAIIMDSWRTERRGDVMEHFSGLILCAQPRVAHPQLSPNLGKSSFIQAPPAPQTNGLYTLALGGSKCRALLRPCSYRAGQASEASSIPPAVSPGDLTNAKASPTRPITNRPYPCPWSFLA